jgi:quercetin dioxygenase-like cupin family protein
MRVIQIDKIEEKRISDKERVKVLIDKNIGKNILSSMIILEPGGIVEPHKHENEE